MRQRSQAVVYICSPPAVLNSAKAAVFHRPEARVQQCAQAAGEARLQEHPKTAVQQWFKAGMLNCTQVRYFYENLKAV